MPTKTRTIVTEPETVNVLNNGWPYAVKNTKHVQEKLPMAFAYRKTKGYDQRIRVAIEYNDAIQGQRLGVFIIDEANPTSIITPQAFSRVSSLGWSLNRSFGYWLNDEYFNKQTFSDGQTYTYNKYSMTLLDTKEVDTLSKCLLLVLSSGDSGLRY